MHRIFHSLFRRWCTRWLRRVAASARGRAWLEDEIAAAQVFLGIGSGSAVGSSGERGLFETLAARVPDPARPLCVFDVGANRGQFLQLLLTSLAGKDFHVHSFEPSPATFALLQKCVAERDRVTLNAMGLGRAAGEFDLFSDAAGSELASLSKRRLDHFGIDFARQERVRLTTVDQYCAEHGILQIDLLKIDVEGHEMDVLEGAREMFAKGAIEMVTFEFGGGNIDSRTFFQDFYYFFHAQGMPHLYRILPDGGWHAIDAYAERLEQFRTTNYVVLRSQPNRGAGAGAEGLGAPR